MSARAVPDFFAVMAVDPGKTTGLAGGLLNLKRAATTEQVMKRAVRKGTMNVVHVEGESVEQAYKLKDYWDRFTMNATLAGVPIPHQHLVIESFQLRQRDAELQPVEVTYALMTLLRSELGWGAFIERERLHFQSPSQAKGYATDARLKKWNAWTVGHEHGRDATRHLALMASKALNGDLS